MTWGEVSAVIFGIVSGFLICYGMAVLSSRFVAHLIGMRRINMKEGIKENREAVARIRKQQQILEDAILE